VRKIIESNPNIKDWATNWSDNYEEAIGSMVRAVRDSSDNGNEFLKSIWADGGFAAKDFPPAMKSAGIDGIVVPKDGVDHFVIYNKAVLSTAPTIDRTKLTGKALDTPSAKIVRQADIAQAKASGMSFDEWVKGQRKVFHGAAQGNIDAMNKNGVKILTPEEKLKFPSTGGGNVGISMTTDKITAQNYSLAMGNKNVGEFYLNPKAKVKDISTYIDDTYTASDLEKLQKQGYDAIRSTAEESEVRVLSDKALKTHSQLKAEWDAVNKGGAVKR
jgi:hypothetical protein